MSSITVTHAPSGLVHANVARTERVTPHMVRVTLTGDDLRRFDYRGFDQWFRLAVPVDDHARFDNLPDKFDTRSYLRYLVLPKSTRPVIRNYTVRAFRRDELELDIDFVCHGTAGVAGPWAESVEPGDRGRVHRPGLRLGARAGGLVAAGRRRVRAARRPRHPARHAARRRRARDRRAHRRRGRAGRRRPRGDDPALGLRAPRAAPPWTRLRSLDWPAGTPYAFAVGESKIATGARRYLVGERGVPKGNVTFCGYWKAGKALADPSARRARMTHRPASSSSSRQTWIERGVSRKYG